MKARRYYILKRIDKDRKIVEDYLDEFRGDESKMKKINKQVNNTSTLLLIEKTTIIDEIGQSEHYTNLWTVEEGVESNWQKYAKKQIMYDYTGVIFPLIHFRGEIYQMKNWIMLTNKERGI